MKKREEENTAGIRSRMHARKVSQVV